MVRAKKGAERLDKHVPEWWTKIDLDTLDMSDHRTCVGGQVAKALGDTTPGYYTRFLESIGVLSNEDDIENGFEVKQDLASPANAYRALSKAWRVEILRRHPVRRSRQRMFKK